MSLENNTLNPIYKVNPGILIKEIKIPTSKSYSNRALILAAQNPKAITIKGLSHSSDVSHLKSCLKKIGIDFFQQNENDIKIVNSFPQCEIISNGPIYLESGDGGTTNRFLLALLAKGKNIYRVFSSGNISNRPIEELLEGLRLIGARVNTIREKGREGIEVKGPLIFSNIEDVLEVKSNRSTQFASALAMILWDQKIKIKLLNASGSLDYFQMTQELVKEFKTGIIDFTVPVDFSSLSYPLALASFKGKLHVPNCQNIDSLQPDSFFLSLLKNLGFDLQIGSEGLLLNGSIDYSSFELDCRPFPDLVPTLVFMAVYSNGPCLLKNINILKYKETDRILEISKILDLFEVQYELTDLDLKIFPKKDISPQVNFQAPPDHRMIMLAYLFMRTNSGGNIKNGQHVKKSFPHFFEIMA